MQVQNANASEYSLPGTIISGNVFRNVNVGVFISESYVGLVLKMPITGKPPLGAINGSTSGAMGHVDPGEWEAEPQCNPGWLRATALAASYPAEFRVGEMLEWTGGHGVISAVHYDKVDKCIITSNQFLRDSTHRGVPNMPATAPVIGVTMGNSSSDVLISGNIFQGMSEVAIEINSSGAIDGCSGIIFCSTPGCFRPVDAACDPCGHAVCCWDCLNELHINGGEWQPPKKGEQGKYISGCDGCCPVCDVKITRAFLCYELPEPCV